MLYRLVSCHIRGIASYSQSKKLEVEKRDDESHDQFEERIWRLKAHQAATIKRGDKTLTPIVIPGFGIQQALIFGAKKGRLKPVARKSDREGLASRLETGIAIMGDAETDMFLENARCIGISAHVTGKRGTGARVVRKFPQWDAGWRASFDVMLLDESLTERDIKTALEWAGIVAGLGRFRSENGGFNGRFKVEQILLKESAIDELGSSEDPRLAAE